MILVCLGLCLGWHPGDPGLLAERLCAEAVTGDPHPLDERPVAPVTHDAERRRDRRALSDPPCRPIAIDLVPPGPPAFEGTSTPFPTVPRSGADRLVMLGVSRI